MTLPRTSTNAEPVRYQVREMQLRETNLMIRYFLTADLTFLNRMGVDPKKLPSEVQWFELLREDFARPIRQRHFYYLVWEANGVPIGHCNINKIVFGEAAHMHLHIWDSGHRRSGCATQLLRPSIACFFETFRLGVLFCEPYALNPGPNRILPKLGFHLVRTYETTPGWITFHQPVNRWVLEGETAIRASSHATRNESTADPGTSI
jgi:RimJ/RimL family protein N-acetyltransferase